MTYAHGRSGMQRPGKQQSYIDHARSVANETLAGGSTAYDSPGNGSTGLSVGTDEWYGVGGATDARTGRPQPGWKTDAANDQVPTALAHVLNTEANNFESASSGRARVYAGSWVREPNAGPGEGANSTAVYDQTEVFSDPKVAEKTAISRDEDAYFDAKNIKEVFVKKSKQ